MEYFIYGIGDCGLEIISKIVVRKKHSVKTHLFHAITFELVMDPFIFLVALVHWCFDVFNDDCVAYRTFFRMNMGTK